MNSLFNTQDNQEFLGIRSDASLNKANKKGTPQYEEWLRKYREKRGAKTNPEDSAKEKYAAKEVVSSNDLFKGNKAIDRKNVKVKKISNVDGSTSTYSLDISDSLFGKGSNSPDNLAFEIASRAAMNTTDTVAYKRDSDTSYLVATFKNKKDIPEGWGIGRSKVGENFTKLDNKSDNFKESLKKIDSVVDLPSKEYDKLYESAGYDDQISLMKRFTSEAKQKLGELTPGDSKTIKVNGRELSYSASNPFKGFSSVTLKDIDSGKSYTSKVKVKDNKIDASKAKWMLSYLKKDLNF